MLNLADFSFLLMILAGPVSGFAAAQARHAGPLPDVLFALAGLAIAVSVGSAAKKFAYSTLNSKKLPAAVGLLVYTLIPLLALFTVILLPCLLVELIYAKR